MWALEQAWIPRPRPLLEGTPLALIGTLGGSWMVTAWLVGAGRLPASALRVVGLTALHGGLLAVALTWGEADGRVHLPRGAVLVTIALIAAGAAMSLLDPPTPVAFVGAPIWLAILAHRGRLTGLGLGPELAVRPVLVGGMIGAFLGGHLLVSASQTLGYPLRGAGWAALFTLWAYDLGANAISAECFFRGALFNRLQRRWSFGPAAALATALSLARYVSDPLLPGWSEVMVGALFYLTILGVVNCWLLWWSGSLVPGLLASAVFFLAYRALAVG